MQLNLMNLPPASPEVLRILEAHLFDSHLTRFSPTAIFESNCLFNRSWAIFFTPLFHLLQHLVTCKAEWGKVRSSNRSGLSLSKLHQNGSLSSNCSTLAFICPILSKTAYFFSKHWPNMFKIMNLLRRTVLTSSEAKYTHSRAISSAVANLPVFCLFRKSLSAYDQKPRQISLTGAEVWTHLRFLLGIKGKMNLQTYHWLVALIMYDA